MTILIRLLYNSDATANCDIEFDGIETSAHTTFTAWISARCSSAALLYGEELSSNEKKATIMKSMKMAEKFR